MNLSELKQFIINNWQLIASACLFIVSFIIGIVTKKKKGYTFSDILLGLIAEQLPSMIKSAENFFGAGNGEQKKVMVLNDALNFASKTLGRKLSEEEVSFIVTNISKQIEAIGATPKFTNAENSKENKPAKRSKYR